MQHDDSHIYISHLTPKEHGKLINLVGRKCSVRGKLNGKTSDVLWDMGAQVSIVSENFVSKTFPNIPIRDVSELLECGLTLTAANGSKIPYVGWVELKFQVQDSANEVSVPFLVTRENLELPLVGFNVIEHMINSGTLQENDILTSFVGINTHNAVTLLDLVKEINHGELCLVKTPKKDTVIPRGQVAKIRFKAGKASKIEVEIRNTTKHDISLKSRTVLGRLQLVQSVTPVEVTLKTADPKSRIPPSTKSTDDVSEDKIREIDLSQLTNEQKKVAEQLLIEQADAFAQSDDDVGSIPNLQMNIHLNDKTPVQKNYVAVPRPLYPEVKAYIEDMLNRKFIRRSNSLCSSPVVCVRKKDQSLRLCVDYRELNRKSGVDRHPIPRIQETLDNLGGNSWFSVLDQGKASYIANFSAMAKPIYDLVKTSEGGTNGVSAKHKKNASQKVSWTQTHQAAFEQLLSHLTRAPVMAYPDATRPYILHTDVSETTRPYILHTDVFSA
ncbi:Hypothetical predicted protein [Paramuricea clavata]|uniref:Uncharacterized protein n=1 Tax=Paramuricea clavata TaxID=317549 RepID=A0A6S7HTU2_PARCT|nr:Hypothetical predicted protein [Paramuricea clavata]